MSSYHCPRCAENASKKRHRDKTRQQVSVKLEKEETKSYKKSSSSKSDGKAAILARVDERTPIQNKIVFSMGIGNDRSFRVSKDGSTFTFTQSGLYRIVFKGTIGVTGKIILHRSPSLDEKQVAFAKYAFGGDIQEVSTMLPFRNGHELKVEFVSGSSKNGFLEAGAQMEIYKVDDI